MSKSDELYDQITATILAKLEEGVVPWHQPWAGGQPPTSMSTGKPYRGINAFLLTFSQYGSPWWGTYKQISERGGQVRKGEKSTVVVFWKRLVVDTTEAERAAGAGRKKIIPMLRHFNVFNACQADGLPERFYGAQDRGEGFDPLTEAEAVLEGYSDGPEVTYGGSRACYDPTADLIHLPEREAFESAEGFYSTAFHECIHSTGHKTRLARPNIGQPHVFGDTEYSKEELVAEMGCAMLAGHAGIAQDTLEQSAAYIGNWLRALRDDKKLLVQAAAQAQRAADHVLGVTFEDKPED
jgi:antirestriction protein ArdC